MCIQHACVCAVKTSPCVPATCPHVFFMWACCRYTRGHFERTHGDVLNAHTEVFSVPHHNKHHTTHHTHTNTHTHTHPTRTHNTDHPTRERERERGEKTEDRRQKREDRRQKREDERREETRREKMKETREEIRRLRDQEKMKLNCLINCPSPKINYYNSAPQLSFSKKN